MTIAIIVIAIVAVLLIVGLVLLAMRRAQRRRELQEQYGSEYDRTVQEAGSRRAAERDLAARREQREQLQIQPLAPQSRARYSQAWSDVQARFVDDPQGAVTDADDLVTAVMRERGYPTEGFDAQARLLSVDHANTLDNYRQGHHIAGLARQQQATTEQLRQGFVQYRTLFQELVEDGPGSASGTDGQQASMQQPGAGRPVQHDQATQQMQRPAMPPEPGQAQGAGYQQQDAGYQQQGAGYQQQDAGYQQGAGYQQQGAGYQQGVGYQQGPGQSQSPDTQPTAQYERPTATGPVEQPQQYPPAGPAQQGPMQPAQMQQPGQPGQPGQGPAHDPYPADEPDQSGVQGLRRQTGPSDGGRGY